MGTAPNTVKVAFIGVTTTETPIITIADGDRGPVLQGSGRVDPPLLRRDEGRGADVIVVLSHLGYTDGGYGYGIPVYGDQTLADEAQRPPASRPT